MLSRAAADVIEMGLVAGSVGYDDWRHDCYVVGCGFDAGADDCSDTAAQVAVVAAADGENDPVTAYPSVAMSKHLGRAQLLVDAAASWQQ